jgi:type II protein arginine methyltransferase
VRLDRVKFTPLTEPFPVFGFDFDAPLDDPSSAADFCREQDVQVNSIATGCANAVVFWFTLTLNRSEENGLADICTYPAMTEQCGAASSSRCWNEALQFVKPVFVEATGTTLTVPCAHSPTRVTFGDIIT